MSLSGQIKALYKSRPGALGQRVQRAAGVFIAGAATPIFTIGNGNVLITALYGEVTAQITTATTGHIHIDPTVGAPLDMDDGTFLYTLAAGQIVLIPMDVAFPATSAVAIAAPAWPYNYIAPPGDIVFTAAAVNSDGGLEWTLFYIPLDPDAIVLPA